MSDKTSRPAISSLIIFLPYPLIPRCLIPLNVGFGADFRIDVESLILFAPGD
ncbi:MAG: hypothetical protein HYR77_12230 [Ignavibacteria bacterium]|nr:hypothetical protein [Ignavibacteria bacterium]